MSESPEHQGEAGFRAQQRFIDPSASSAPASSSPGSSPIPPEWTAPTPPNGFPAVAPEPEPQPEPTIRIDPADFSPPPSAEPSPVSEVEPEPPTQQAPEPELPTQQRPVEASPPPAAWPQTAGPAYPPAQPVHHHHRAPDNFAVVQQAPLPPYAAPPAPSHLDLSTVSLLGQPKQAPSEGWRKWLYVASFKTINVGESPKINRRNALAAQVRQPLHGCYRIALLSLKGGVGKTTITATLGATIASIRGDRVVAVDANPDRGTLSQKVPLETPATVRDLLRDEDSIQRYSDVRRYTSQGPSRLEVLASESDPAVSEAFSSEDYIRTLNLLERFYSLVLTDCGTGLMHSAMSAVLDKADALIVISSGSVDGARSASATLDWLDAHGHQDLVQNSIAVINAVRPRSGKVDMQKVVDHFSRRSRAVLQVPFDPHLEEGAEINLEMLKPVTREALIELAAVVADGFAGTRRSAGPLG